MNSGDGSISRVWKAVICLVSICLANAPFGTAPAYSENEMDYLKLYFEEKELLVSATRHPKPPSQVAGNVTVITAEEIRRMNAHTVAEALRRVTGMFVVFSQGAGNPGSASLLEIHGSESRQVLVLVDEMPWNYLSGGNAETNAIPVGIIDRIEVVKGPASSVWGSSLGGVVHIITKAAGRSGTTHGLVRGSYGEGDTQDLRGEIRGEAEELGYYLFAGFKRSDGLAGDRDFESPYFFSKTRLPLAPDLEVDFSIGYSEPDFLIGDYRAQNMSSKSDSRAFWFNSMLHAELTPNLSARISLFSFQNEVGILNSFMETQGFMLARERVLDTVYDEYLHGGTGKLVWQKEGQTAVIGFDYHKGRSQADLFAGPLLQMMGMDAETTSDPVLEKWGVYANYTLNVGRFSLTPGIRLDHHPVTDLFVSPSLGATFFVHETTLLRAQISRGFSEPPVGFTSQGGFMLDPNPDLDNETIWSYQAGIESTAARYVSLRLNLFRHEIDDPFRFEPNAGGPPRFNGMEINQGEIRNTGFELEAETVPFSGFQILTGFGYTRVHPTDGESPGDRYAGKFSLRYTGEHGLYADLFGYYLWLDDSRDPNDEFDPVWDLNVIKRVLTAETTTAEVFFTVHNLFNGSQYLTPDIQNPERWVEGGVRIFF